ncbi:undecaprenyl/decaprenyl-phosphate alpha-N-acetylglucosaminyl 1-phosphate transferase [bacterium]|nr:undecaprenyl/decaprenyl-phosphate alpha-N-acetylglucosaminyl 1-phosphate transferase [bacterium]
MDNSTVNATKADADPITIDGPARWTTRKRMILPGILLVLCLIPAVSGAFHGGNLTWLYVFVFAWALSSVLTPLAIRLSFRFGWLDIPGGRKAHGRATPLLGGLAIIGSFGVTLLVTFTYSLEMKAVGLGGLLIWLVGVVDDRWELPAVMKLLAQLGATALMIAFGVHVTFLPDTLWGIAGEWIITAFWILGITNAVNFLDGMDGLAAGMSAIIAGLIALVALQTHQYYFMVVSLALFGACTGFLPYNFRRGRNARIFLGDNGSTFLGFTLAATTLMGDWADNNIAGLIVPILLLSVPIFDMTMTTIVRFGTGKVRTFGEWLAYTGRDHFHHRLAALGIGRFNAVLVIYTVTVIIGIPAVVLKQARGIDAVLLLSQSAFFFLLLSYFMIFVRTHQIRLFVEEQSRVTDNGHELDPGRLEILLAGADQPEQKREEQDVED